MISQWLQEGSSTWTGKRPEWTLEEWYEAHPANSTAPTECDHESDPWTSGGLVYKVCTNCLDDETEGACETRHEEAVAFWMSKKVPD